MGTFTSLLLQGLRVRMLLLFLKFKFYLNFFPLLVAKKKSLFDDRPMEIQELTYIIKQVLQ